MKPNAEELAALKTLIEQIKVGMLTTVDARGKLRSRPLQTLEVDDEGRLWFFTAASSAKTEEIEREHGNVGLAYADPGKQDYVSVSGSGRIVRDRARMERLYTPWVKVFFPNGLDDPDLALLCVTIEQAEYWDSPSGAVRRLYGATKAMLTGDTSAVGENRKI